MRWSNFRGHFLGKIFLGREISEDYFLISSEGLGILPKENPFGGENFPNIKYGFTHHSIVIFFNTENSDQTPMLSSPLKLSKPFRIRKIFEVTRDLNDAVLITSSEIIKELRPERRHFIKTYTVFSYMVYKFMIVVKFID